MANDHTAIYYYIPNIIGYVRLAAGLASFYYALSEPKVFVLLYFISYFLDALDGHAARMFNQCSTFGAVFDMVLDRSSTAGLLLVLSHPYKEYMAVFVALLGLDISSHYCQMYATLACGGDSHKKMQESEHWMLKLYYHNRTVLFTMCFSAEAFLMLLYLNAFLPTLVPYTVEMTYVFGPLFAIKQVLNILQWNSAASKLAKSDWAKVVAAKGKK